MAWGTVLISVWWKNWKIKKIKHTKLIRGKESASSEVINLDTLILAFPSRWIFGKDNTGKRWKNLLSKFLYSYLFKSYFKWLNIFSTIFRKYFFEGCAVTNFASSILFIDVWRRNRLFNRSWVSRAKFGWFEARWIWKYMCEAWAGW